MAKTAKTKKRHSTLHSRASRRAVSSSIDLDKSLKASPSEPQPPPTVTAKPHVLAVQSAGIQKKSKSKPLKRQQRLRQQKGMVRAEDNIEKLALKVEKSMGKEKKIRERRKGWEEVNGERSKKKARKENVFEMLEEEDEVNGAKDERMSWGDGEIAELDNGGQSNGLTADISGEVRTMVIPESILLPAATADGDEVL